MKTSNLFLIYAIFLLLNSKTQKVYCQFYNPSQTLPKATNLSVDCEIEIINTSPCPSEPTLLGVLVNGQPLGNCSSPIFSGTLQEGLIGWWPFCGDANDLSGNNNHGTVFSAELAPDRFNIPNSAYYFNGSTSHIKTSNYFETTNNMSISFWCKKTPGTGVGTILTDGSVNVGGADFLINTNSSNIGIRADKSGNLNYEDSSPQELTSLPIENTWVHIIWVLENGFSKVYLNGNLIAEINEMGSNEGFHDPYVTFGARNVWSSMDNFFNGYIDDIAVYNRAINALEASQLFYLQPNIISPYASVEWSTGSTSAYETVYPSQTTTYTVTVVQDGFTCQNTVEVQVVEPSNDTLYAEIVEGSFYSFNNQILTNEGIYTANLNNAGGCDSIVTLVLSFGPFACSVSSSDFSLCTGEETILTVQTNAVDTLVWGPNLLNGPFTGGTLSIIEFSAAQGASNYGGNGLGSNCNELWRPYGTFCDEGIAANSPFLSEKSNNNSGATWNRGSGGYGVLVLDLQDVKTFNALSAFQMFSDGKLTELSMFYWPENNTAIPASSNTEWIPLFTNELIGPGAQSGNTVSDPTLFEFETIQSRYIMFHAYNSGIYGSNTYIEIRSLKLFNKSQANSDILWSTGETTPTITVSPTQTTTYSVTVNQGGQTCNSEVTVSVSQAPNVSFEPDLAAFCNNSGTVDLSGGSPAGGTYSGPGVVNNTFSPALAGGGLHTITYTVSNSQGCTDEASTTFEVAICTGSSINEPGFASVWPNPFDDIVNIRLNTTSPSSPITLRLTDAAGRIVVLKTIQENQNDFNVDVSQLSQGIYTLSLSTSEQHFVSRLVK